MKIRLNFIFLLCCYTSYIPSAYSQWYTEPRIDTIYQDSTNYLFNSPVSLPSTGNFVFTDTARALVIQSTEYIQLREGFVASAGELCGKYVLGIANCPTLQSTATVTQVSCNGGTNGAVQLFSSGGREPYYFKWDNLGQVGSFMNGRKAGTYSYTIFDTSNCITTGSVQIAEPAELVIDAHRVSPTCNLSNGSISLSCTGGSGPYIYDWIGYDSEDSILTGIPGGLYDLVVFDAKGCMVDTTLSLSDSMSAQFSTLITPLFLCDDPSTVILNFLSPAQDEAVPVNTCDEMPYRYAAGTHDFVFEDTSGCVSVQTINIPDRVPLTLSFAQEPSASSTDSSLLTLNSDGGYPPYAYQLDGAPISSNQVVAVNGLRMVSVTDSVGCFQQRTIYLGPINVADLGIQVSGPSCYGGQDGEILILDSLFVGNPAWYDGEWQFIGNGNALSNCMVGNYYLLWVDTSSSTRVNLITVTQPEKLSFSSILIAENDSVATLEISVSGGVPPYSVSVDSVIVGFIVRSLAIGLHDIAILDANGCSIVDSIEVKDLRLAALTNCNNNTPYSYPNIVQSCTTCNPCTTCGQLNIVTDFGAVPDDGISDEESFEWANEFISTYYCGVNPVRLEIPPGEYIVGRQDQLPYTYKKGHTVMCFVGCQNLAIVGISDPITGNNPTIKFDDCLYYGAFDPATGKRHLHNTTPGTRIGNVNDLYLAAYPGAMFSLQNCAGIDFRNLNLNGNLDEQEIGGYFSTDLAGINLPYFGIQLNHSQNVSIRNCNIEKFGQDGIIIQDMRNFPDPIDHMDFNIENVVCKHNARCGNHWNGGKGLKLENVKMNQNGFSSWGGTKERDGLEIEIDNMNYEDLANGLFINCEFKYNNGCAIQNNGQSSQWYWKYYNYTFKNCIMVSSGQNSYSSFWNSARTTFECCKFIGQVQSAYDALNNEIDRTIFSNCSFEEEYTDPEINTAYSFSYNYSSCLTPPLGPLPYLVHIDLYKSRVEFNKCKFISNRFTNWMKISGGINSLPQNNLHALIKNCTFKKIRGDRTDIPGTSWGMSRLLIEADNTNFIGRNVTIVPHNPQNFCQDNDAYPTSCWWGNMCSVNNVVGRLRLARGNAGGICDPGPIGSTATYCVDWFPDGYSDASYIPGTPPCIVEPYERLFIPKLEISCGPSPCSPLVHGQYVLADITCSVTFPVARTYMPDDINNSKADQIRAYPSPSTGSVTLENLVINQVLHIYTAFGDLIFKLIPRERQARIDVSELPSGIYYLQQGGERRGKLIVLR